MPYPKFVALAIACFFLLDLARVAHPQNADTKPKPREMENVVAGVAALRVKVPSSNLGGEKIPLYLVIENRSKEVIRMSDWRFSLDLALKTTDGKPVPRTLFGQKWISEASTAARVTLDLPPGKTTEITMNLDRLFDLTVRGKYTATVHAYVMASHGPQKLVVKNLDFSVVDNGTWPYRP